MESQLFSLLGAWVAPIPELDAKALVAEHAEHAAWRAQRWFEVVPAPGTDPGTGVAAPEGASAIVELSASLGAGEDRTVEKLAVVYRVLLPRLLAAYTAHLDWSPVVSEGAVRRLLVIAAGDVSADLAHGERLLQAVADAEPPARRARAAVDALDDVVTAQGGLLGPGSVGVRPL
jgi:hypothetical protein